MTERIDLDDLNAESEAEEPEANEGDWFWNDGDSAPATDPRSDESDLDPNVRGGASTIPDESGEGPDGDGEGGDGSRIPHVPYENKDKPVGIPVEQGGAGGDAGPAEAARQERHSEGGAEASGPHGGGADDMTMAFTYDALRRLEDLQYVLSDVNQWCDWLGLIGDVDAHVLNKFQRNNQLDFDFFNGSGTGPGKRLAEIDEHSMFFAERMAVVGTPGEERIAEVAGWEFVPLEHAAGEAGWELDDPDAGPE